MDTYDIFRGFLKDSFSPQLRAEGFKGSGTTFRRIKVDAIHVLNVQGSRSGGKCCVNLGVHFAFLPTAGDQPVADLKKLKEYECDFRARLHEAGEADHWWDYGVTEAEAQSSCENLIDTYRRRGAAFFDAFEPSPDVFDRITPAELDIGDCSNLPPTGNTLVRIALTMSRIMKHLGQSQKCREFAEVGLHHLGQATGLRREFERLRSAG